MVKLKCGAGKEVEARETDRATCKSCVVVVVVVVVIYEKKS